MRFSIPLEETLGATLEEEAGATMARQRITHVEQQWGSSIYPAGELHSRVLRCVHTP